MRLILSLIFLWLSLSLYAQAIDYPTVFIKGAAFALGSNAGKADERPVHVVKLNDYSIGKYEVTQALWKQVMGEGKVKTDCPNCAVYDIPWDSLQVFLTKLTMLSGHHYRLPTEAEWEYAATGADQSKGYKYSGSNNPDEVAWYAPNSGMKTHPVGGKKPNEIGLYDMSGNVWELCSDWYQRSFYKHSSADNPVQAKKKMYRLLRGGSWRSEEQRLQAHARNKDVYDHHISNQGFRLVMDEPAAQTSWVDSMDNYARDIYLPARHYRWTWQNASLLHAMVQQYDHAAEADKPLYFDYIKKAMDKSARHANGKMPNAVASGLGMAFLYRVTHEEKYKAICDKIYRQYLHSKRTKSGAVSHVPVFSELWDDTMFMVGEFLLAMWRATGDEQYLDELTKQMTLHRAVLLDPEWGLWVHGWDQSDWGHCLFCSQVHWSKRGDGRSAEVWGRGNGWILVTLSDALDIIPTSYKPRAKLATYLWEMTQHLPELQDTKTGHWYQLPVRKNEKANFIESSCTAMFAYGLLGAVRHKIGNVALLKNSAALAYAGLRNYSTAPVQGRYLTTANVCKATCIGNKSYYFHRKVQQGKAYGLASFLLFGRAYEASRDLKK